jgi:leucyl/phenylalanyl-tRNA--protein transferase
LADVVSRCADPKRPHGWISDDIRRAYGVLHDLGWAHSVEAWDARGELAGGLYGIAIGGAFAGESMFHRQTDASKVAFAGLVDRLRTRGFALLDAQVMTEHLASLGCAPVRRREFLDRLAAATALPRQFGE